MPIIIVPPDHYILRASKQVFNEAQSILYRKNVFSFFISTNSWKPYDYITPKHIHILQRVLKLRVKVKIKSDWNCNSRRKPSPYAAKDESPIPLLNFSSTHPCLEDLTLNFQSDVQNSRPGRCPTIRLPPGFWTHVCPPRNIRNVKRLSFSLNFQEGGSSFHGALTRHLKLFRDSASTWKRACS